MPDRSASEPMVNDSKPASLAWASATSRIAARVCSPLLMTTILARSYFLSSGICNRRNSARRHALFGQLLDRRPGLRQMRQSHSTQYVRRLGELDVVVTDDLDPVAPWVQEVEKWAGQRLDPRVGQRFPDGILVIDHEAEVAAVIGGLRAPFLKRKELVAQVDEGGRVVLAAKLELEQAPVEGQGLLDVANLERDVIEPDGAR